MMTSEGQSHQRLGDFEIVREIGRGGMGIVYEARQVSLNRKVALKVLAGSLGLTSKAVVRFRREAEAAAKLHHTNIVPIYATGEHEGTHYYAMELVEGPSLNVVVKALKDEQRERDKGTEGRRDEAEEAKAAFGAETESTVTIPLPAWVAETIAGKAAPTPASASESTGSGSSTTLTTGGGYFDNVARMVAEVADALDYAHNQGVIHRDIKPSNLLLSPAGRLSINDFGLARMLEHPGMTMTGEFVGTPMFMSPEQITAGRAPLDHRTDIYSLGATLYELLTLEPPFPGQRRDQIIAQIIGKEPKPPRRHNKRVPVDLETICLKAMEKDPDRRYQTAGQMAEDLRRFVNRFAISAKRAGPVARIMKWARRRPAIAALIGLVIVISAAAGLVVYRSHLIAVNARIAEGQRALDNALVDALSGRYDQVEPWLERAEVLDVDPGRIRVLRGLAAVERGKIETAIHELELAVQQLPNSLGAHALLARAYAEAGRVEDALVVEDRLQPLEPVTVDDYLYGAWAIADERPEQAREWHEYLVSHYPTPAVHYAYGVHLFFRLWRSYSVADIDRTLAHMSAAQTGMPDNSRAALVHSGMNLVAADIYRLEGDTFRSADYLSKARRAVDNMRSRYGNNSDTYEALVLLASYEKRWEDVVHYVRAWTDVPGFWPYGRFYLPIALYVLGRYEEALEELSGFPEDLKATGFWIWYTTLLVAELHGKDVAEKEYFQWRDACVDPTLHHYGWPFKVLSLLGEPQEGFRQVSQDLADSGRALGTSTSEAAYVEYLAGRLSEENLLATATERDFPDEAHFAIALARLGEGDRQGASEHLALDRRTRRLVWVLPGPLGRLLLARLQEDPSWPPWIPVEEEDAASQAADEPDEHGPDDEESP